VVLQGQPVDCKYLLQDTLYSITIVLQSNMQSFNLLGIPQTVNIHFVGEAGE
jgi:hypothetical protein